jgi:hypothetical protein
MNDLLIVTAILAGSTCGFAISSLWYAYQYKFLKKDYEALKKEKVPKLTDSEAVQRLLYDMSSGEGLISVNYVDPSNIYYHRR